MKSSNGVVLCDFCGNSQHMTEAMVAECDAAICSECIDLCTQIMAERRRDGKPQSVIARLKEKAKALRNL